MKSKTLFTAFGCALLCATTVTSCAKEPAIKSPAGAARPGLWKIADADTTIYLFGTIHVLPPKYQWRTAAFNKVAAKADTLVLEVADLDDRAKTAETFTRLAVSPGLPPVLERVSADKRAGLKDMIDKSGFPPAALDKFESWAVAITLAGGMLSGLDLSPDDGVERNLAAEFKAAKKPLIGLETSEGQLSLFDKLPESAQRTFLASMVDQKIDPLTEFNTMLGAWAKGNDKAIAVSFDDELRLSTELTDVLIRKRNASWTKWIEQRLRTPGTVLIAVGAGHLAGSESVQTMLKADGYKVSRVQ